MTRPPPQSAAATRFTPLQLWLGLVLIPLIYWAALAMDPRWLLALGVHHVGGWFLDLFAILASNDALARGLDVYAPNPLDLFARPHVYSHWWFVLGKLGLTQADNFWLGLTLAAAFFITAAAHLRPVTPRELLWYITVLASSPMLLAVERANNDLVIFLVLAPVVPCLLSGKTAWQIVAGGLIALAAGLKFYPAIAALLLLAPIKPGSLRVRLIFGGFALATVMLNVLPDFIRVQSLLPRAEGLMTFGSANLFTSLGLDAARAQLGALAFGVVAVGGWLQADIFSRWEKPAPSRGAWLQLVLGAALLTGCFFSGTSYAYRWIFALWLAPGLWRIGRDSAAPQAVRRLIWITGGLLLAALWIDPMAGLVLVNLSGRVPGDQIVKVAERVFAVEQPVTWALFICLLGFLTHFVRDGLHRWRSGS